EKDVATARKSRREALGSSRCARDEPAAGPRPVPRAQHRRTREAALPRREGNARSVWPLPRAFRSGAVARNWLPGRLDAPSRTVRGTPGRTPPPRRPSTRAQRAYSRAVPPRVAPGGAAPPSRAHRARRSSPGGPTRRRTARPARRHRRDVPPTPRCTGAASPATWSSRLSHEPRDQHERVVRLLAVASENLISGSLWGLTHGQSFGKVTPDSVGGKAQRVTGRDAEDGGRQRRQLAADDASAEDERFMARLCARIRAQQPSFDVAHADPRHRTLDGAERRHAQHDAPGGSEVVVAASQQREDGFVAVRFQDRDRDVGRVSGFVAVA